MINLSAVYDELLSMLKEDAKVFVGKAKTNLDPYLKNLASWGTAAIASGNKKLLSSVEGQLKLVAQLIETEAAKQFYDTLNKTLQVAIRVGLSAISEITLVSEVTLTGGQQ